VLLSEGFEGAFPGAWEPIGDPTWGRTDCKTHGGKYAIWPAAGGSGAVTPCTDNYPNNIWSLIVAGPFDLSNATAAELVFDRWQQTEYDQDSFSWLVSIDGSAFSGWQSSGDSGGWQATSFDLTDLAGQPQVWIAFGFESDASGTGLGVWVDNVVLRKK
jgi:hypothetical protein